MKNGDRQRNPYASVINNFRHPGESVQLFNIEEICEMGPCLQCGLDHGPSWNPIIPCLGPLMDLANANPRVYQFEWVDDADEIGNGHWILFDPEDYIRRMKEKYQ